MANRVLTAIWHLREFKVAYTDSSPEIHRSFTALPFVFCYTSLALRGWRTKTEEAK